jgi:hypothetical protein
MKSAILMFRRLVTLMFIFLSGALTYSQAPTSAAHPQASTGDINISAEMDKLVHVKRVKVGAPLTAHLTASTTLADGTELPKGSKLVGTVTEVKVKADKQGPSKLGLLFTGVVAKNGSEIPLRAALVSVAPHFYQGQADLLTAGNPQSSGGRMVSGTGANTLNTTTNEGEALSRGLGARAPTEKVGEGQLKPGVSYLPDVTMVAYSAAAPGTVLESAQGSVYVDSGSRLLVLVLPR